MTGQAVLYSQCSSGLQPLEDLVTGTCFPPGDTGILDFTGHQKGNDMAGNPRQLLPSPPISNMAAAELHSLRCFTKWFSKCEYFFDMIYSFAWAGNHLRIYHFSWHKVDAVTFLIFLGNFCLFFFKPFIENQALDLIHQYVLLNLSSLTHCIFLKMAWD